MMKNELTQKDTAFILWVLGLVNGQSDGQSYEMDERHKIFIKENHDRVMQKIGDIHESFNDVKLNYKEIKRRIVAYDTVLGIGANMFSLKKGDEFLSFETDIYGRVRVNINGIDQTISKIMLDRISNIGHLTLLL